LRSEDTEPLIKELEDSFGKQYTPAFVEGNKNSLTSTAYTAISRSCRSLVMTDRCEAPPGDTRYDTPQSMTITNQCRREAFNKLPEHYAMAFGDSYELAASLVNQGFQARIVLDIEKLTPMHLHPLAAHSLMVAVQHHFEDWSEDPSTMTGAALSASIFSPPSDFLQANAQGTDDTQMEDASHAPLKGQARIKELVVKVMDLASSKLDHFCLQHALKDDSLRTWSQELIDAKYDPQPPSDDVRSYTRYSLQPSQYANLQVITIV
jgi:hypothetical protein